jgi:hypothetical protein
MDSHIIYEETVTTESQVKKEYICLTQHALIKK